MNNLNRAIKIGEKIVMLSCCYIGDEKQRTVEVIAYGFGLSPKTVGRAIMVRWHDGEECRVNGDEIDQEATDRLQSEGGNKVGT